MYQDQRDFLLKNLCFSSATFSIKWKSNYIQHNYTAREYKHVHSPSIPVGALTSHWEIINKAQFIPPFIGSHFEICGQSIAYSEKCSEFPTGPDRPSPEINKKASHQPTTYFKMAAKEIHPRKMISIPPLILKGCESHGYNICL